MLPRKFRLPVKEFRKQKTFSIKTQSLLVRFCPNHLSCNRFAVIISAKTEPKSVRRHAIKRKIFAVVEKWPNLKDDFLITIFPFGKNISLADFKIFLEKELKKIPTQFPHV